MENTAMLPILKFYRDGGGSSSGGGGQSYKACLTITDIELLQ
jgi:hypothetical protein